MKSASCDAELAALRGVFPLNEVVVQQLDQDDSAATTV